MEPTQGGGGAGGASPPVHPKKPPKNLWKKAFLKAFAKIGSITAAATAVGVTRWAVHKAMARSDDFRRQVDAAAEECTDRLEAIAVQRATRDENPSDLLLIFLLKARKPEKYRDNYRIETTGADGGPIAVSGTPGAVVILPGEDFEKTAAEYLREKHGNPQNPPAGGTSDPIPPVEG